MSTPTILFTGQLRGLTAGGATIATVNPVTFHADGYIRWTDANSRRREVLLEGDLALLFRTAFTGASGITQRIGVGTSPT